VNQHYKMLGVIFRPCGWINVKHRRYFPSVVDKTHENQVYNAWRRQMNSQCAFFQTKYAEFLTSAVAESGHDSRALWSRVNKLSVPPDAPSSSHTMQDFVTFLVERLKTSVLLQRPHHHPTSRSVQLPLSVTFLRSAVKRSPVFWPERRLNPVCLIRCLHV